MSQENKTVSSEQMQQNMTFAGGVRVFDLNQAFY
jgi:hypothetical protein